MKTLILLAVSLFTVTGWASNVNVTQSGFYLAPLKKANVNVTYDCTKTNYVDEAGQEVPGDYQYTCKDDEIIQKVYKEIESQNRHIMGPFVNLRDDAVNLIRDPKNPRERYREAKVSDPKTKNFKARFTYFYVDL